MENASPRILGNIPLVAAMALAIVAIGCDVRGDDGSGGPKLVRGDGSVGIEYLPGVDTTTAEVFRLIMDVAEEREFAGDELGAIMQQVGTLLVGAEYEAGMLDEPESEEMFVSLQKFDCVLFVESVLAVSQGIAAGDGSLAGFVDRVRTLRYRGGVLDGYCSRLHYFTEWIADNEKKGHVHNVTLALGGLRAEGRLDFMSRNRNLYARFATNDSLFGEVRRMEDSLSRMDRWYIPQRSIRSIYPHLKAGDIIATSTTVEGLDVSHSGLAYRHADGRVGLLHASTSGGVAIAEDLADYVLSNRATDGIVVARPVDTRVFDE